MNSFWLKYGVSAVALVFVGAAFLLGISVGENRIASDIQVAGVINKSSDPLTLNPNTEEEIDFAPFWRVWNVLNNKFVPRGTTTPEQIRAQEKVWSAITGLVDAYDDPYTVFLPPEETESFKESAEGSFEGVGMVVGLDDEEQLVVVAPLENSPAMKAGLRAGDIIRFIDGESADNFSIEDGVSRIRGPKGTEVLLTVSREGESENLEIVVTRGNIDIPSTATTVVSKEVTVTKETQAPVTKTVIDEETGEEIEVPVPVEELGEEAVETVEQDFFVLQLFNFSESSVRAFRKGLEEFAESGTNKLIVDLRGNPGGFLESAVDITSYFLPKDTLVVQEIFGAAGQERIHVSKGHELLSGQLESLELVILINRGSASASEILAGALQEYDVATVIGEKSFGKGSVQELIDITGDVSLKVTVARWYTPDGVSISEGGLIPDIEVDPNENPFTDRILEKAVEFLSGG